MHCEETVSHPAAPGNIVNIGDFGSRRREQIEEWLKGQIFERYGERGEAVFRNPLIRLSTIFAALSDTAQHELHGYARRAALGERGKLSMSKEFRNFLEMAPAAWEDIEEFADTLLVKEKTYKQIGGMS